MNEINQGLLILHFLGLALGLSASIANLMVGRLIAAAAPGDRAVLARVPPVMGNVGGTGLILLWISGVALVFTRWGGFGTLPGLFHAKVTAVVLLTGLVGFTHALQKRARLGDTSAPAKLGQVGRVMLIVSVTIVVLAVLTFD